MKYIEQYILSILSNKKSSLAIDKYFGADYQFKIFFLILSKNVI